MNLEVIAILALIVLPILLILLAGQWLVHRRHRTLRDLAARQGLVYAPGHDVWSTGTISGRFRDRMITLDEVYDDSSGTCTRITLRLIEPSGGQLTLHPRPPVESDQPSFAFTFIVEGEPQDFAEQVFASTDLQQNLMLAHTQHTPIHELKLQGWGLSLLTPGILHDTAPFLSHCCDLLSDIADRIEDLAATTA